MRIYFFTIVIITTLMTACSSSGKKAKGTYVELKDTTTISTDFGLPLSISLYKEKLFISDFYGDDGFVKVLDTGTGKIIGHVANKGDGPNELLSIGNTDCISSEKGDLLYVFDPMAKKIQQYNIDNLSASTSPKPLNTFKLPTNSRYSEIMRTPTGYIASGLMENKKFILLNDSLQECGHGGHYAPKPSNKASAMLNVLANNGKFAISKDRKHIVNIIYIAGIITCYTLDDTSHTISLKWEKTVSNFNYEVRGEAFNNNEVMGYQDISLGNKFIYALYSGETEDPNAPATYGKEIHVYNYDGNLVKLYKLSQPVFSICIDENHNTLYAAIHEPTTAIIKYASITSDMSSEGIRHKDFQNLPNSSGQTIDN